jgi:hypothetical protein
MRISVARITINNRFFKFKKKYDEHSTNTGTNAAVTIAGDASGISFTTGTYNGSAIAGA